MTQPRQLVIHTPVAYKRPNTPPPKPPMYRIIGADGREYGPVSADVIREWIAARRADGCTQMRAEAGLEWKTLAEFPEFADALNDAPRAPAAGGTQSSTGSPADAILARRYEVNIGDCFSRGWKLLKQDFWLLVGVTALFWVITLGLHAIPILGQFAGPVLFGPLCGGWDWVFLKRMRGQAAFVGDFFFGFGPLFVPLLIAGILYQLLGAIGLLLCLLPGIYLLVAWCFCLLLVMDKGLDFWAAMETSRRVVTAHWWTLFGLAALGIVITLAGSLALVVGMFVTGALANGAFVAAYEDIFGEPKPPVQTV